MARRQRQPGSNGGQQSQQSQGPSIDRTGAPVIDPTENVLALVQAAVKRQDDLRNQESAHVRELMAMRAAYEEAMRHREARYQEVLRHQEAARIDAIRAVDVTAAGRAVEVSTLQATTLASQVDKAAEAMRSQVALTASAAQQSLTAALEPIQTAINDLRKAQYEQQGQKFAQSEGKDTSQWVIVVVIGLVFSVIQIGLHFIK